LTLAIISNSFYLNTLIDEISKEKDQILKNIQRTKRIEGEQFIELSKMISKQTALILFNQKLPKVERDSSSDS
jgi:hypothetical protein